MFYSQQHTQRALRWAEHADTDKPFPPFFPSSPEPLPYQGVVQPLLEQDAGGIARASLLPGTQDCSVAENLVRGLIRRNRGAGIRRGGHLVSWWVHLVAVALCQVHTTVPSQNKVLCALLARDTITYYLAL